MAETAQRQRRDHPPAADADVFTTVTICRQHHAAGAPGEAGEAGVDAFIR